MRPFYYSLNEYIKEHFDTKLYKIALDGGMTCPNRDGTISTRGCIFCSEGGSGDFGGNALLAKKSAAGSSCMITSPCKRKIYSIDMQIEAAKSLIAGKYKGNMFIAYFQSFTNTYAPIEYLRELFFNTISRDDIAVLSIATRPDCITPETAALLSELNRIKPVWIELGLQTIHPSTSAYIRSGFSLKDFDQAVRILDACGIRIITHMIIGLPGETMDMMMETARYIAAKKVFGIKLQLLHVLKNTDLARDYYNGIFQTMQLEEYLECIGGIIQILPPSMVIHRITGDGPKSLLIAPEWSSNKKMVYNSINKYLSDNNIYQGRNYR